MHKILIIAICIFQLTQTIKAQQPIIKVADKDSAKVILNSLKIDVKVVGNIAITTMQMEFCNKSSRILEGELTFPMPEGVSISRYAIDMNGTMREAVPVEKEKGQVAFENIIRRKVDPGLLEKVEGNNFRTRIYPLPANGCRTIIIAYQEALFANQKNELSYNLPLQSRKAIPNFSFAMNVYTSNEPEIGKSCNTNVKFTHTKNCYQTSFEQANFKPNGSFQINMPKLSAKEEVLMQKVGNQYYFLANHFPEYKAVEKKMPTNLHIIWDNSFSGLQRDHKKEIDFVRAYMQKMQSGNITLSTIGYSFKTINTFVVASGTNAELINTLDKMIYDGATNLSLIQWNKQVQETLLFSDGLNTYGNFQQITYPTNTLHTITAAPTANFSNLQFMATKAGGQFINLNAQTISNAIKQLNQQVFRLINVKTEGNTSEIYPSYGVVKGNLAVSGITTAAVTNIVLEYGYGNTVTYSGKIELDFEEQQTNDIALDKIWAQQKITQLEEQYDVFKNTIQELGKKYNVVTRNTSLIVLDEVADYVKYGIEPPIELKTAYDSLIAQKNEERKQQFQNILTDAQAMISILKNWHAQDFAPKIDFRIIDSYDGKPIENAVINIQNKEYKTDAYGICIVNNIDKATANIKKPGYEDKVIETDGYSRIVYDIVLQNKEKVKVPIKKESITLLEGGKEAQITGIVTDEKGQPLPGVYITLKGTKQGTSTDINGNFAILNMKTSNQSLTFNYVGFRSVEGKFLSGKKYQITLKESEKHLEEVVVTGYSNYNRRAVADSASVVGGNATEDESERVVRRNTTSSITTVSAESISNSPSSSFDRALAGKVFGTSAMVTERNNVTVRGAASIANKSSLIIVDGVEMDKATFGTLDQGKIQDIAVLKDAEATALYGSRANNGVMIVTTKKQEESKKKAKIEIKTLSSNKEFIQTLKASTPKSRYEKYLQLRTEYLYTPSFYFEVANLFFQENDQATGLLILSTVADMNLNDHELYKMLGYQLKKQDQFAEAKNVFKKVLDWRPQEPQSYRDYGLALQDAGLYQNALDTLYLALTKNYDSEMLNAYKGIEETILLDINNIIALQKNVNTSKLNKNLIADVAVDVRIVLNWNMNDSDMDLWVIDPRGEKCFYSNKESKIGGRISDDFTQGYGPEQFLLKQAKKGNYKVMLHYYGDRIQKVAGGATILAEIYTNYGKSNQERKIITLQMEKEQEKAGILVGEFSFE